MFFIRYFTLATATVMFSGCASFGNFLAPPHPATADERPDAVCLTETEERVEDTTGVIIGFLVQKSLERAWEEAERWVEREKARYTVDYLAQETVPLFVVTEEDNTTVRVDPPRSFELKRFVFDDGSKDASCEDLIKTDGARYAMSAKLELLSDTNPTVGTESSMQLQHRLVLSHFVLEKARAKVPVADDGWKFWTWLLFDDAEDANLDINLRIELLTEVLGEENSLEKISILKVDFPLDDIRLGKEDSPVYLRRKQLASLASGPFSFPALKDLPRMEGSPVVPGHFGNLTIKATVTEAHEFGSVIEEKLEDANGRKTEWIQQATETFQARLEEE